MKPLVEFTNRYFTNNFVLATLWLTLCLLLTNNISAQAPANDNYANAIDMSSFINGCSADAAYTTFNASPDRNSGSNWNIGSPNYNVWFKFTAPLTGQINIAVDRGGSKGSQRHTQLALWEADGLTELNSDRYVGSYDDVTMGYIGLMPGNTYYISVDSFNTSTYGTFTLCLEDEVDYDFYEGAIDVTSFINGCSPDAAYDTRGASPDRNKGSNWNNSGPKYNRWFKFTAPASGQINIAVDRGGSKGSQRHTQLALWESDGMTELDSDRYVGSYDDVIMGYIGLVPGNTYYISVDSYNTSTFGTFTLCLEDEVDYDFYEGAIDVTSFINGCSPDAAYDTRGASPDRNKGSNWDNSGPRYNRWFKFTAPASGQINIKVDINGAKGSQRHTQLALWEADGLTELNSDRYVGSYDDVTMGYIGLMPGNTYYISVDSYNTSTFGTFTLCLEDEVDYDFYEGAINVTSFINGCSPDAAYDTRGASPDRNKGSNWDNSGPRYNRWFKFTAPATGQINITIDINGAKGSQRHTQLALWESDGMTELNSDRYVSSYDDVIMGYIGLVPGNTYYISVDSYNTSTFGTFTLCLEDKVDYDFYEGAMDVTSIINACSADAQYSTTGASPDRIKGTAWNNSGPKYNRWFKFIAPTTGQIYIKVDRGGSKGSQYYTQLALWQADGLTEIDSDRYQSIYDDVDIGYTSLTPGDTYYISVDTYNSGGNGTFTLCLEDKVDYDFYEGAIDVTSIINGCSADAEYSTAGASPDKDKGLAWNNSGPRYNRWFKFTATPTGQINIRVDVGGAKGSQYYTQLALWEEDGVTEITSDRYQSTRENVDVGYTGLISGSIYYISVDTYNEGGNGTFTLCLEDKVDYDFYEGAIDVTFLIDNCSADAEYTTVGASPDKNKGSHWNNSGPRYNRWFKFIAPASDQLNITVDIDGIKGSQYYTQLALWDADGVTEVSSTRYTYTREDVTLRAPGLTAGNTYYISVDTYSTSSVGSFTLCLNKADNPGQIVINEVLFAQTAGGATNNDEFIELYNAGPTAVDLTGWQLLDGNLLVNYQTDNSGSITGSSNPFTFNCTGSQICSGTTLLQPGDYAVIWVGSQTPFKNAANATFQAWLGQSPKLNNSGDDIWLFDANTTLVDYVAYGANNEINTPPLASVWVNTYQNTLSGSSSGQSIDLTPNGVDGNASDCWGPTTSGQAASRCSGYLPTVDSDVSLRSASPGDTNNSPDNDNDGIADSIDLDDDNDGILDVVEGNVDTDGDGILDYLDLDSDNDGIYDAVEAGHGRPHTNGVVNGPYGNNGLANVVETVAESGNVNYTLANSDGTGLPDFTALDSDGDGCTDANEAYRDSNADGGDNGFYGTGNPPPTDAQGRVVAATYPVPADGNSNGTMDYKEATAALAITVQPMDTVACPGCNATISVTASSADTYQWQYFNGSIWLDLTDSGIYTGTATSILSLTNVTMAYNGSQYRVVLSNKAKVCDGKISNNITLTVRVSTVITNKRITVRVKKN